LIRFESLFPEKFVLYTVKRRLDPHPILFRGLMMKLKVTLISPYQDITANGLRIISSYLKRERHDVDLIFLNITNDRLSDYFTFNKEAFNDLVYLCKSSDLIGFSLMSSHFVKVKELTIKIKEKLDIPIIWGGIHPSVKPEECLKYADMVCIGEGEETMLELANKLKTANINNIKNIWLGDLLPKN
jgi:radical SAM superfamily enzyme YgiQ (UPF0313 family)